MTSIFDTPELKELWAAKGVEFAPGTTAYFAEKLRQEYENTAAVIREAGVKPEY